MSQPAAPVMASEHTVWCEPDASGSILGDDFMQRAVELDRVSPVTRFSAGGVLVTGADAADEIMHDTARFSSRPDAYFLGSEGGLIPIQVDPPEHTRYRRILDRHFSPRVMEGLREPVAAATRERVATISDAGSCDLVADLGIPVPSETILALLGFSIDRLDDLLAVKNAILHGGADEGDAAAGRANAALGAYDFFESVLRERESDPREDMATFLIGLEKSGELTRRESLDICLMLLIAGLDTVTATAANMFLLLAERPDLQRRLADDASLVPSAVEEFLRITSLGAPSPPASPPRTPRSKVARSPEANASPCCSPVRTGMSEPLGNRSRSISNAVRTGTPAFGLGRHRCLGSHLARMELQVILAEWHALIPEYRLRAGFRPEWRPGIREISSLPIEFGPSAG